MKNKFDKNSRTSVNSSKPFRRDYHGKNNYNKSKQYNGSKYNYAEMVPWKVNNSEFLVGWFKAQQCVTPRDGEGVESMLKRFKHKCEKSGILKELRRREYHKSKGVVAREKKLKALKRYRKEQAKRKRRDGSN